MNFEAYDDIFEKVESTKPQRSGRDTIVREKYKKC